MFQIDRLPVDVILNLCWYLQIQERIILAQTCKKLYNIIHSFAPFWKKVELSTEEGPLVLLNEDIKDVLQHSGDLFYLSMPYLECDTETWYLDYLFCKYVRNCSKLVYLDLSGSHMSTLCFLVNLKLETLKLADCMKLIDEDFLILQKQNLKHLDVSYTAIQPRTLVKVTASENLEFLEAQSVIVTVDELETILDHAKNLRSLNVTIDGINNNNLQRLQSCRQKHNTCKIRIAHNKIHTNTPENY